MTLLDEALEITKNNGVDDPNGTYTMFILKIMAPWINTILDKKTSVKAVLPIELEIPQPEKTDWDASTIPEDLYDCGEEQWWFGGDEE